MKRTVVIIFFVLSVLSLVVANIFDRAVGQINFNVMNGTDISSYFILVYVFWFVGAFSFSLGVFLLTFLVLSKPAAHGKSTR
ncbi:MAG: hypothetical protein ABIB71_06005 [Candidatus Woesearchaeota archaeon]